MRRVRLGSQAAVALDAGVDALLHGSRDLGTLVTAAATREAARGKPTHGRTDKPRPNPETTLSHAIRKALNAMPDIWVMRNTVGMYRNPQGIPIVYGLGTGSSDIIGILKPTGRWFCCEVKMPGKQPSDDQTAWLNEMRAMGAFGCVVWSVNDALDAVDRARRGASS